MQHFTRRAASVTVKDPQVRTDPRPLVIVAGARPNFVKIAPLIRALDAVPGAPRTLLIHTGQHYDHGMSEVFFDQLGIKPPDVSLGVGSGTHGEQTARILEPFERLLMTMHPAPLGVVVVGDVNSTMACALAATKLGVRVAHVEAGLRSFDRTMPEEINRIITDALADLLLVSDPAGEVNLRAEGIPESRIRFVGNVMIDSLVRELPAARELNMPSRFALDDRRFGLVTLHRPSNVDNKERLSALSAFLAKISESLPLVWPLHPRTAKQLETSGLVDGIRAAKGLILTESLGYRELIGMLERATVAITDSGGVQEESTFLRVPCITLRDSTERPVTETLGTNTVVGMDLRRAEDLIHDVLAGRYKAGSDVPGWDGRAAERCIAAILEAWG